jgi:septum site-determining protein MinC
MLARIRRGSQQGRYEVKKFAMSNPFNEDDGANTPDNSTFQGGFSGSQSRLSSESGPSERRIEDRNSVITARGTAEGLVLRVDGRVETTDLVASVREFIESRRSFLSGNDVAFEWIGKRPEDSVIQNLTSILSNEFAVAVRASKSKNGSQSAPSTKTLTPEVSRGQDDYGAATFAVLGGGASGSLTSGKSQTTRKAPDKTVSLFDGIEAYDQRTGTSNPMSWDDPDTRMIYGTLRSGQKVETEHSIVVFGDVNSGAEVIAGGDIVILGTLRGIAHAGAYDESGGGRVIFSLNLQPTQLRIGLVISRGSGSDSESTPRGGLPEVARVDGNMIVVEPYQSRTVWVRRRE